MSVQVKNIFHTYNKGNPDAKIALKDVSFSINEGEILGVIGHTGSGKSTMLQHLNGLLKPDSGQIMIGDIDITDEKVKMTEIRKRVGLYFNILNTSCLKKQSQKMLHLDLKISVCPMRRLI